MSETPQRTKTGPIGWSHQRFVHTRRVQVLASHFADLIEPGASVLDVGCGDGLLSEAVGKHRPDLTIHGIDVLVRGNAAITVEPFDGTKIPFQSDSFDTVMMVDVLHHTGSPQVLLDEAARVASKQVILKDHYLRGFAAYRTLALMDRVGNSRHGVEIPCNYLTESQWDALFQASDLRRVTCRENLGLYPPPLSWIFERKLHFIASLEHRPADPRRP